MNNGINPSIVKLLVGKHENSAIQILQEYKKPWRIYSRDGKMVDLTNDRNDSRYNLIIYNNKVWRVIDG